MQSGRCIPHPRNRAVQNYCNRNSGDEVEPERAGGLQRLDPDLERDACQRKKHDRDQENYLQEDQRRQNRRMKQNKSVQRVSADAVPRDTENMRAKQWDAKGYVVCSLFNFEMARTNQQQ